MKAFSHIGLYVSDMERSLNFYTQVLGLRLFQHFPDTGTGKDIAFVGIDSPVLELLCPTVRETTARETRGCYDHFAWCVEDIAQAMHDLRERGVTFTTPEPLTVLDGRKIAFFSGPDGERIEIVQPPKA